MIILAKQHGIDLGKLVAVWAVWFWGINWNQLGAFLSCLLTLLFILDKLGILTAAKEAIAAQFRSPSKPLGIRTPQDE